MRIVSVLQVTWESVSGTASHVRCIWTCNEIEGSYDKIIITVAPSYTRKNITRLLPLALLLVLRTRNNTDGDKLVIFSGIGLYYGDNYTLFCSVFRVHQRIWCTIALTFCWGRGSYAVCERMNISDASVKHIWAPPSAEAQRYSASNSVMLSKCIWNNVQFLSGTVRYVGWGWVLTWGHHWTH